jgi:hypothetical protein
MAKISTLPTELLIHIFRDDTLTRFDRHNVSLTSKFYRELVVSTPEIDAAHTIVSGKSALNTLHKILRWHAWRWIHTLEVYYPCSEYKTEKHSLETVHQEMARRSWDISWFRDTGSSRPLNYILICICLCASNIRRLKLSRRHSGKHCCYDLPNVLNMWRQAVRRYGSLHTVTDIDIDIATLFSDQSYTNLFDQVPNAQRARIHHAYFPYHDPRTALNGVTSRVNTLTLVGIGTSLSGTELRNIFYTCPSLSIFVYEPSEIQPEGNILSHLRMMVYVKTYGICPSLRLVHMAMSVAQRNELFQTQEVANILFCGIDMRFNSISFSYCLHLKLKSIVPSIY